jgi:hypothetical protein
VTDARPDLESAGPKGPTAGAATDDGRPTAIDEIPYGVSCDSERIEKDMCRRVICRKCGKPGYAGCGMHVEQVLAGVRKADRCSCTKDSGGWLAKLFGKGRD